MSSSPPTERRRLFARWSLRAQLLAVLLALFAVVCAVIGVATTVAARELLIRQFDSQVASASFRNTMAGHPPGRPGPPQPFYEAPFPPGQAVGTVSCLIPGGRSVTSAAYLDQNGAREIVPAAQWSTLDGVPRDGRPHTRDLGELGEYRLLASRTDSGDVIVTGLPLTGVRQTVWDLVVAEAVVAGLGLLFAGLAVAAIVPLALRPLRRVAATASRVAELPLDRGEVALSVRVPAAVVDSRTEVGQVAAALNRMLGHVADALSARQASETRVRQFVADASHELRTPLAAIRGYAEVTRRGGETVPPDVAYALARVESETTRMTALVDDLLLLARLDAGRPLARDDVDLSRLVVDAVSDAHVAGPGHTWTLDVAEEPVTVPGDEPRLHQVLANLLANARTHTPPGSTVHTRLWTDDGQVLVSVADDGPGVPPALQPDLFERFSRGDTSRSRAAGSTGLGLAIVAAVVEAHAGSVTVESRPGGTVFRVRLPRA